MDRRTVRSLAALLVILLPALARGESAGERLCWRAAAPRDQQPAPTGPYQVDDRFGQRALGTGAPVLLCRGSRRPTGPTAVLSTTTAFRAQGEKSAVRAIGERLDVNTRFGAARLRVKAPTLLAFEVGAGNAGPVEPIICYAVRARERRRVVTTAMVGPNEEIVRVGEPRRLCVNADGQGGEHLCLQARRVERQRGSAESIDVTTALGTQRLDLTQPAELCVPIISAGPPPPPPPPFTLRINPASLELKPGETGRLTVAAFFKEGGSEDYSERVTWVSSNETIATVHTSAGGAFVTAGMRGTATISAVDPKTSISSADTDGDAELTVVWPLEKLTISPPVVRKKVGESEEFTVTGYFTGGTTMNLTQRVTYSADTPYVVSTPNKPGRRSLVHAIAPGIARIRATDPYSGITTTHSGNDATLRVGGGIPYIQINPTRYLPRLVLRLGQSEQLTAVAVYPDQSTKNVTQQCVWSSEDQWTPNGGPVVLTPNTEGDRSRIDAVATGTAWVICNDPESGTGNSIQVDVVTDQLVSLRLVNGQWPPLRDGVPRSVTALGTFAPFEPFIDQWSAPGTLNVTQDVTYVSRDPDIAIATNEPGDRSRIVGVGPGVARIYAFDPTTGIESPDHPMLNLGQLTGIMLNFPRWDQVNRALVVGVGARQVFTVRGIYEVGVLKLRADTDPFVLESADPSIAAVPDDLPTAIEGISAGRTSVTVRHLASGLVSVPFEVTVEGEMNGIDLEPKQITRALGDEIQFTGYGLFPPDFRELMTQRFEYRSSDPSVAVATNEFPRRSLIRMVGAGTAVISAFDPSTGVDSSDSGGDAVVEVLPGAIERVTVEPIDLVLPVGGFHDYTAIGHYADGRQINVSKQVHWAVTVPSVASAPTTSGGNSRIQALAAGTSEVVATHLSGVSSNDTGDNARLTVRSIASVALTPATRTAKVGSTIRYTVSGTLDDGSAVNLTQRAWYWIEPFEAAVVSNDDDDRSRFDLRQAGPATVHAELDGWSLSATLTIEP